MQKVLNAIERVRFTESTLRHASIREEVTIAWKNTSQTSTSAKSQRYKIRGPDKSDLPKARLGMLPKICTSSQRTTRLYSSRLQSGFSQVPQQESRRRDSLWLIPGRVCTWSVKKDLNFAELVTMRTSSGPMTVTTANGEVRTKKEATV